MFKYLLLVTLIVPTVTFFQWVDDYGTISFTDDIDRIPEEYFEKAIERSWIDLRENTDKKLTIDHTQNKGKQDGSNLASD